MEDPKIEQLEINVPEVEEVVYETEGLSAEDLALVEKHGLIPKTEEKVDGTDEKQPEPKKEEDSSKEAEDDDGETLDPASFEDMEEVFDKNEDKFHKKFTSNAKALYFQMKKAKHVKQELQKKLEEREADLELHTLKNSVNSKKLEQISELLSKENLTIEELQAVLGSTKKDSDGTNMMSKEEFEAQRQIAEDKQKADQESFNSRVALADSIGRSKYDNFDAIAVLAKEMIDGDSTMIYKKAMMELFNNKDIDEDNIVEGVVRIAQLNPKFKETVKSATPEDKEKVDRVIKNSKKQVSSASVTGGAGRKVINYDDLTIGDIATLSTKEYMKIPKNIRERVLSEAR